MWGSTWLQLAPGIGLRTSRPAAFSGDEPHYMLVVNSLLFDHDLDLRPDYERVRHGSSMPATAYRGQTLHHHSMLVNRRTGRRARWLDVYGWGAPKPCPGKPGCTEFTTDDPEFQPSADVYEVSSHGIAFPALLAGAIAPLSPKKRHVERDASRVMVVAAWLAVVATYVVARGARFTPRLPPPARRSSPWRAPGCPILVRTSRRS